MGSQVEPTTGLVDDNLIVRSPPSPVPNAQLQTTVQVLVGQSKESKANLEKISKLVSAYKRKNRVYLDNCFKSSSLWQSGALLPENIAKYDRVVLESCKNELIDLIGFAQNNSFFHIKLSVASLFANVIKPQQESNWRLGCVELSFFDSRTNCQYTYNAEQTIDYDTKRRQANVGSARNIYKIGSFSYEVIVPFALSRVYLNGIVKCTNKTTNKTTNQSVKLTISTHPTSDKFDYRHRFESSFVAECIGKAVDAASAAASLATVVAAAGVESSSSLNTTTIGSSPSPFALGPQPQTIDASKLLNSMLEDRIDVPSMFQLRFELLDANLKENKNDNDNDEAKTITNPKLCLLMWGAKAKNFVDVKRKQANVDTRLLKATNNNNLKRYPISSPISPSLSSANANDLAALAVDTEDTERLFIWTNCVHQLHLNRLIRYPECAYGLVHNDFDYSSPISSIKLFECDAEVDAPTVDHDAPKASVDDIIEVHDETIQENNASKTQHKLTKQKNKLKGTLKRLTLQRQPTNDLIQVLSTDDHSNRKLVPLSCLPSFAELTKRHELVVRAFKLKDYVIKLHPDDKTDELERQAGKVFRIVVNDFNGFAVIQSPTNVAKYFQKVQQRLWLANICDRSFAWCLASEQLLGGKGNSLIELQRLAEHLKHVPASVTGGCYGVSVPRGFVVSCLAYDFWLKSNPMALQAIDELDSVRKIMAARCSRLAEFDLRYVSEAQAIKVVNDQCVKTCKLLAACKLPVALREQLANTLRCVFPESQFSSSSPSSDTEIQTKRKTNLALAVRSSALGEDSADTSAAGQMCTKLNVKSFDAMCTAIVDCWTSQFESAAVNYKSQNGLPLNAPMAVVVQELIDCTAAGVAATCDPITGNAHSLTISSNYGLGESIVSASAEPDTITVDLRGLFEPASSFDKRTEETMNKWLCAADATRRCKKIIGSKLFKVEPIRAENEGNGLRKTELSKDENKQCSLSDAQIIYLANLLLYIKQKSEIKEREIEWGVTRVEKVVKVDNEGKETEIIKSYQDNEHYFGFGGAIGHAIDVAETKVVKVFNKIFHHHSSTNKDDEDSHLKEAHDEHELAKTDPELETELESKGAQVIGDVIEETENEEDGNKEQVTDETSIDQETNKEDVTSQYNAEQSRVELDPIIESQLESQVEQQAEHEPKKELDVEIQTSDKEHEHEQLMEKRIVIGFKLHLLQSRPLTNLHRMSDTELDHEIDTGLSPNDQLSRGNLGEVLPDSQTPLGTTFISNFFWTSLTHAKKPYEQMHTMSLFSSQNCAHICRVFCFEILNGDILAGVRERKKQNRNSDPMSTMIGTKFDFDLLPNLELIIREKITPLNIQPMPIMRLMSIITTDLGIQDAMNALRKIQLSSINPEKNLTHLESLLNAFESQVMDKSSGLEANTTNTPTSSSLVASLDASIESAHATFTAGSRISSNTFGNTKMVFNRSQVCFDIIKLFEAISNTIDLVHGAWKSHIVATLTSMAFSTFALEILSRQPHYENAEYNDIVADFGALMMADKKSNSDKTESADISELLTKIIDVLVDKNELYGVRDLTSKQLHALLMGDNGLKSKLYKQFIEKNKHRGYKEFDIGAATWGDDPSYLIKSLKVRISAACKHGVQTKAQRDQNANVFFAQNMLKFEEIVNKNIQNSGVRLALTKYILPRAKHAANRREKTKSSIIASLHKYRKAFRHLAALLCLDGRIPNIETMFYLTLDELKTVVYIDELSRRDLPAILYKARRRRQRASVLDKITFTEPTLPLPKVIELMQKVTNQDIDTDTIVGEHVSATRETLISSKVLDELNINNVVHVVGFPSCNGRVEGKCVVVKSIDDVGLIEQDSILITYSIDICWSVYFPIIKGIVTEIGAVISHGCVVAREYNLPTLCCAPSATSIFKSGQKVVLDATRGVCYLDE